MPAGSEVISRLERQFEFIREIDKLKHIGRQTLLMDASRYENDAEHSWHLCVMALVLSEYAENKVDICRVISMVVIHDMVEIYAGDTFCYDTEGNKGRADREKSAAEKIFGLLPEDQASSFKQLWLEFEARLTPESKFAAALDRLQPVMHNYATQGAAWQKHGVTARMVRERNAHISEGSEVLWAEVRRIVEDAVAKGFLSED